jgi:hypothetical protein
MSESEKDWGNTIAQQLNENYNNRASDCGSSQRPAFLCSGIMLRGTTPSDAYHSWNPSPSSQESGGVSFSYLRKDSKYKELAYDYVNGFIFRPYDYESDDKIHPEILCSFPLDGHSFSRDEKGCGQHIDFPEESKACQSQGVITTSQWKNHFLKVYEQYRQQHQCGFNVSISAIQSADAFKVSIDVRDDIVIYGSFDIQNEIRLATWEQDIPNKLPIMAFFYTETKGLAGAQHDQLDFYNESGRIIPIIKMSLPLTLLSDAKFTYSVSDQKITP